MNKSIDEYEIESRQDLTCPLIEGKNKHMASNLDISGYAVKLGILRAKWAKYLYLEEKNESDKQQVVDSIFVQRWRHYLYDSEYVIEKKDIPMYIKGDTLYQKAEAELKEQSAKVKYINEVLSALNNQSFFLNTAMKHIAWQSGETA